MVADTASSGKERTSFLTAMLVLFTAGVVLKLIAIAAAFFHVGVNEVDSLLGIFISGLFYAITAISLVGIWNWKKWAVYLYVAMAVVSVFLSLLAYGGQYAILILGTLIGLGLFLWAISRDWVNFN